MKISVLQWDEARNEPYLQLRPGFRLTPTRIEDVQARNDFWNTEDVRISKPDNPKPFPLQKTREAVEGAISSAKRIIEALKRGDKLVEGCPLGVVRRESDQAWVGMMTVHPCSPTKPIPIKGNFDYDHPWTNGCFQLGYALVKEVRGQGLSTEMVKVFIDGYLRPIMGLRTVGAVNLASHRQTSSELKCFAQATFEGNVASRAVLRDTGFREIYRWTAELPEDMGGGSRWEMNYVKDLK